MANVKITELDFASTPLAGSELIEIVQGGVNKKVEVNEVGGGGGVTEFIELTDVPTSYTGQASKVVAVKADESGLEFVAGGGTTPTLEEVLTEGNNTTKDIEFQEDTVTYIPRRLFSNNTEYGDTTFEVFMNDPDSNALYGLSHKDNTTGALSYVRLRKDLITMLVSDNLGQDSGFTINLNNVELRGNMGDKGLVGFIDFSANYDNLTYVQKIYVDNAIAGVTTPDATPTVKGIAKLYTSLGSNTDGAVDQNTVNSALALKANAPLIDTVSSSALTGVTTEGILKSYLIPANTYTASEILNFANDLYKTGTAGTVTSRLYTNTTASLSGASLLATNTSTAGNRKVPLRRQLVLKGGNIEVLVATQPLPDDNLNSSTVASLIAFNPAVDNYFITTAQNANAGDSTLQNNFKLHY